jgi:F-type H+-transporting ATPase subunit delta
VPTSSEVQSSPSMPLTGSNAELARRYARALFELASEQKAVEAVAADMQKLQKIAAESEEYQALVGHPRLTRAAQGVVIEDMAKRIACHVLTTNFLRLAARHRRLSIVDNVAMAYLAKCAALRGEKNAELSALLGGHVHLTLQQNPSLLGGFIVQQGSRLWDASIKGKLRRLSRQLQSDRVREAA